MHFNAFVDLYMGTAEGTPATKSGCPASATVYLGPKALLDLKDAATRTLTMTQFNSGAGAGSGSGERVLPYVTSVAVSGIEPWVAFGRLEGAAHRAPGHRRSDVMNRPPLEVAWSLRSPGAQGQGFLGGTPSRAHRTGAHTESGRGT